MMKSLASAFVILAIAVSVQAGSDETDEYDARYAFAVYTVKQIKTSLYPPEASPAKVAEFLKCHLNGKTQVKVLGVLESLLQDARVRLVVAEHLVHASRESKDMTRAAENLAVALEASNIYLRAQIMLLAAASSEDPESRIEEFLLFHRDH